MQLVEIRGKGRIHEDWSDWLADLTITHTSQGETVLSGTVRDQASLSRLLVQMSNLGSS
jgi:hypothetical protein